MTPSSPGRERSDPAGASALLDSLKKAPPPRKLLPYVEDKKLRLEPVSKYEYSNTDNVAIALIVKAATGRTYKSQLREQVYGPLGLKKTTLPAGPNLRAPYIHGYDNDPKEHPPEDISELVAAGWAWASGGMVFTPADLNDFVRGYVGGDRGAAAQGCRGRNLRSHQVPGRTLRDWASSATRRSVGRCGATRVTSSATLSSWPPARTDAVL